jgi:carbamoyl-phosphate synthase large subunit
VRIQIGGAGGAPANNVIRSLRRREPPDHLIGTSSVASDLLLADTDERHVVPPALAEDYPDRILALLGRTRPDLLIPQHDYEVRAVSRLRDDIHALGVRTYLPAPDTVEACVDKFRSWEIWRAAGLPVPRGALLREPADLARAVADLGGRVWIRATTGGGGRGALPTDDLELATRWIEHHHGWGEFMAAELLTDRSVTWQSIWHEGQLVVAQTRLRRRWAFSDRAVSGVTGITAIGETTSDPVVDRTAQDAILAIDRRPHGIFGVDMTYDDDGIPNPTEINVGRFFTTIHFFTEAGLNMPLLYRDIALGEPVPALDPKINPLPNGLVWVRGMDVLPVLSTAEDLECLERDDT